MYQVRAHRVVLAACSPRLRSVLRGISHSNQQPVIYLWGMQVSQVQALLSFMYHGEVNIAQEELQSFLTVAKELQVKGLVGTSDSYAEEKGGSLTPDTTESLDNNSNYENNGSASEDLHKTFDQRVASWGIIKMKDYLVNGTTKQQYFKESFVKSLMIVSIE